LEDAVTTASADHLTGPHTRVADRVDDLDAELRRAVRRTSAMRQAFYVVVLLVALAGQVSGAVQRLDIPLLWAIPAVAGLELGGVVVLANADVRRRLGERAIGSRLLSALIAAGAVAFNWFVHTNHLLGAFFAGMSALGYLVWLIHTESQRRDRLRARGDLPPITPAYEVFEHWLRHPALTLKAKSLAKADPTLGLYGSLDAARIETRRQRRQHAISVVLHRKIRAAVDPTVADIAVAVYDLGEIAARLADSADYDTLTALINADLAPARLTAGISAHFNQPAPTPEALAAEPLPPITDTVLDGQGDLDVPAGASPVNPDGTPPRPVHPSPPAPPAPVYEPVSDEDAAMYQAWCTGVEAGQEPTGADLARAAGRADDATGIGRRAARRYRDAHAAHASGTGHNNAGDGDGGWQSNGHRLTSAGAIS
jgi:hypothetical protein